MRVIVYRSKTGTSPPRFLECPGAVVLNVNKNYRINLVITLNLESQVAWYHL